MSTNAANASGGNQSLRATVQPMVVLEATAATSSTDTSTKPRGKIRTTRTGHQALPGDCSFYRCGLNVSIPNGKDLQMEDSEMLTASISFTG